MTAGFGSSRYSPGSVTGTGSPGQATRACEPEPDITSARRGPPEPATGAVARAGDQRTASLRSRPSAMNSASQPCGIRSDGRPGAALTQTAGTRSASAKHQSSGGSDWPARNRWAASGAAPPGRAELSAARAEAVPGRAEAVPVLAEAVPGRGRGGAGSGAAGRVDEDRVEVVESDVAHVRDDRADVLGLPVDGGVVQGEPGVHVVPVDRQRLPAGREREQVAADPAAQVRHPAGAAEARGPVARDLLR